ncbi:helix-turn-helix domain-containing protein [Algoriphagus resistens]|uniref:helix-turn-helix domain-containing protein n=1 Tax=Algoriphagus resistens TaxID=1750590 RepID=UPI0007168759|nr:helix-turn-helix transcriptional regulator [Algoriphagus resistens]
MPSKIIEQEMSEMDFQLIFHVKKLREDQGLTQVELSQKIGLASGFVGKVETFGNSAKYNIRHLPLIAKALGFKNVGEVLPKGIVTKDLVKITLEKVPLPKKNGEPSQNKFDYKILEVVAVETKNQNQK